MTTPGQLPGPGENPQQIGSGWNQDVTEESVKQWARNQVMPGFGNAFTGQLDLWGSFKSIDDFLIQLKNAITKGQIPAPGPLLDIFDKMDGVDDGILDINKTLNQIRDVFNNLVVTPINSVVSGIKDWFNNLLGWKSNTTESHQSLVNDVWAGVTQQAPVIDKTPEEVKDAVSALKARSDSLRTENELRYSSSVAIWQGVVPGGDVTCPVSSGLIIDGYYDDEGTGRYHRVGSTTDTSSVIALFRARSSVQRDIITFLGKVGVLENMSDVRVLLWSYREEEDMWEVVATSPNIFSEVSTTPFWIDALLESSYTPYIGELMGVSWWVNDGQMDIASNQMSFATQIPAYHSVPYGTNAAIPYSAPPVVGSRQPITPNDSIWYMDAIPFAQVAPDLGQIVQSPPQYWFDDFNTPDTSYNYTGIGYPTGGILKYIGTTDGIQRLCTNAQMSTDRMRVEATSSAPTAMHAKMILHCTSDGKYGVELRVTNVGVGLWSRDKDGTETMQVLNSKSITTGARWALEFDPTTSTYRGYQDGVQVFEWADPTNIAYRGRGRRSAGLAVCRDSFVNSAAWDDFLVYDVTD